jgi:hypothetical protein
MVAIAAAVIFLAAAGTPAGAADRALKPYLIGYRGPGTIETRLSEVKASLEAKGFEVAGEYRPYKGAHVVVVTSGRLQAVAAKSSFGGYGAVQRVSLTETGKELQVAATNPQYFSAAYRMQEGLDDVAEALGQAIGATAEFGAQEGMTAEKLRKYHYMVMMPYFDDPVELAKHPTHDAALKAVEDNLAAGKEGTRKVYRVDIPGKKQSVFGVSLTTGDAADAKIMKVVDIAELKHTPHLPYELLVSDGKAYMLHGKFRIALDFPDLTMGTFMKISSAPNAIEYRLKLIAGGE